MLTKIEYVKRTNPRWRYDEAVNKNAEVSDEYVSRFRTYFFNKFQSPDEEAKIVEWLFQDNFYRPFFEAGLYCDAEEGFFVRYFDLPMGYAKLYEKIFFDIKACPRAARLKWVCDSADGPVKAFRQRLHRNGLDFILWNFGELRNDSEKTLQVIDGVFNDVVFKLTDVFFADPNDKRFRELIRSLEVVSQYLELRKRAEEGKVSIVEALKVAMIDHIDGMKNQEGIRPRLMAPEDIEGK